MTSELCSPGYRNDPQASRPLLGTQTDCQITPSVIAQILMFFLETRQVKHLR